MTFAHAIQSLWPFHGPLDPRNEREIDDDLDAEFAFHLERAAHDLEQEGHDREAACGLAQERFGDLERYKKQCRRIALKERVMLQRVNFVMMLVVMVMVVGVGIQVWITQKYNTLALQAITSDLARMKFETEASAHNPAAPAKTSITPVRRTLEAGEWREVGPETGQLIPDGARLLLLAQGDVRNLGSTPQGVAVLPGETSEVGLRFDPQSTSSLNLTIFELLQGKLTGYESRWQLDAEGDLLLNVAPARPKLTKPLIMRRVGEGENRTTAPADILSHMTPGIVGARVDREWQARQKAASTTAQPEGSNIRPTGGRWMQVQENGQRVANGLTIDILPFDDIRYEKVLDDTSVPMTHIDLDKRRLYLVFLPDHHLSIVERPVEVPSPAMSVYYNGRWTWEDGTLLLNLSQARPKLDILRFVRSDLPDGALADSSAVPEQPDTRNRTPFRGVKWAEWTPYVDVQTQWYELLTVDGIPASVLLDHLRQAHAGEERLWFSEHLIESLTELGRNVGDAARLELRDPATGTKLSIDQAQLTAENFERVKAVNKSASDAGDEYAQFVRP